MFCISLSSKKISWASPRGRIHQTKTLVGKLLSADGQDSLRRCVERFAQFHIWLKTFVVVVSARWRNGYCAWPVLVSTRLAVLQKKVPETPQPWRPTTTRSGPEAGWSTTPQTACQSTPLLDVRHYNKHDLQQHLKLNVRQLCNTRIHVCLATPSLDSDNPTWLSDIITTGVSDISTAWMFNRTTAWMSDDNIILLSTVRQQFNPDADNTTTWMSNKISLTTPQPES